VPSITPIMVLGFIYRPAAMTPGASLMSTFTCTGSLRRLNASARRLTRSSPTAPVSSNPAPGNVHWQMSEG